MQQTEDFGGENNCSSTFGYFNGPQVYFELYKTMLVCATIDQKEAEQEVQVTHLPPGMGGIWVWGVEAGVGGFRSPDSAIELLVDWGV